jgi:hypothetical protein
MLDAEAATRGRTRFYCSYDDLLARWPRLVQRAQDTLSVSFPRATVQAEEEIGFFLSQQYRHHHKTHESVVENPHLSVWIRDSFRVFDGWAANGEDAADYPVLDHVRDALDAAGPAFARVVGAGRKAAQVARRLEAEMSRLVAERGAALENAARLAAERDRERALHEIQKRALHLEYEQKRAALEEQQAEASRVAESLNARLINQERENERLQVALEKRQAEASLLAEDRMMALREAGRLKEELGCFSEELGRLRNELASDGADAANQALTSARGQLAESQANVRERFDEIATLTRLLREQEAALRASVIEAEWVRHVAATLLAGGERWRGRLFLLLPGYVIRMWVLRHLRRNGVFDAEAYLRANPDVARRGADPLRHYIHHGMKERRPRS